MFKNISVGRLAATSVAALLTFTAPTLAASPAMVAEIDVGVALSSLTNPDAATRFANLQGDLESAIATRLADRIDVKDGVKINVDISEAELSNSFTEAFNLADTRLVGIVQVIGTAENPVSARYDLTVDVNGAKMFMPEGTIIETLPADSAVYYDAMIAAFADAVVIKLDE